MTRAQHPIRASLLTVLSGLLIAGSPTLTAEGLDVSGQLALELRWFPEDPAFPDQFEGTQVSGFVEPEFSWKSADRKTQVMVTPFARIDAEDDERTHVDLREAYWRRVDGDWEYLVGVNRVFWGVTESRHLVNIINQVDAVEDVDEEDFLGQFMVQVGRQTDIGRFDLFLMTGFRERTFPDREGRLRTPLPVETDAAEYESGAEEWRPDIAFRYSHFVGDVDIGLHVFHGTSREPNILVAPTGQDLVPLYPVITQFGVDLQLTRDAWLWKFEGLGREGQGDTFAAAVAGVEYTLYQLAESNADLGIIVEGLYDGRDDDVSLATFASGGNVPADGFVFPTLFDQDVFFGLRLAMNDVQDTTVLAGVFTDVDDGLAAFRLEAERRIGQDWKVEFEGQVFFEDNPDNAAALFEDDSFLTLRLSRFF